MTDDSETVVCVQQGVFRTNCIDCLDRTNVVQSMLARKCLEAQMVVRIQWMCNYNQMYTCVQVTV